MTRRVARPLAALALTLAVLATAGCGTGSGSASAGGSAQEARLGAASADNANMAAVPKAASGVAPAQVQEQAVISTGHIALTSVDVAATRARLDDVLIRVGGHVADENTVTDDDGDVTHSHVVVRVPSADFDRAMTSLAGIASLRSASRQAQDVTTEVIDLHARILAERAGVRRLRHLVSQTADLRALLAVERALTARQGELESLRQQQAYLADRTSQATITVDIARRVTPTPVVHAAGGFVGGLHSGWGALVSLVTGLLVALGAALPFGLAAVVLGVPAWLVVRRGRRTRGPSAPAES